MPLACCVCGTPWKLDRPLLYHGDRLHCDTFACSRECGECKDWEHAIEDNEKATVGARPSSGEGSDVGPARIDAQRTSSSAGDITHGGHPDGSFTKAPGYAAMMARLKGGESK